MCTVLSGKTVTLEPDMKKELKRGSMKEKWGLNLSYTLAENKLQVAVNKVDLQHSYNKWILQ